MRRRKKADQSTVAAVRAKTTPMLVTARRRPGKAGPTKKPRLSTVLATAFAAVSSPGARASTRVNAA